MAKHSYHTVGAVPQQWIHSSFDIVTSVVPGRGVYLVCCYELLLINFHLDVSGAENLILVIRQTSQKYPQNYYLDYEVLFFGLQSIVLIPHGEQGDQYIKEGNFF